MASKLPKGKTYEDYPFEDLCIYGGIDNIVTSEILAAMWKVITDRPSFNHYSGGKLSKVKAPSIFEEHLEVKSKAIRFVCDLERAGMAYNIDGNRAMDLTMRQEIEETKISIFRALGREFNLESDVDLGDFLYGEDGCNFDVLLRTKHNAPATSGDALKALYDQYKHEWLLDIKKYVDISSMHNSFIKTYVGDWIKSDGRVHPQYNLHGTSSHRISSSSPNLLNLPRGYYGYNIRQLYTTVGRMVFLTFDFSSCEVKILAALSGDPMMIQACRDKLDFHSFTASMMYNLDYDELVAVLEDEHHPLYKEYKNLRQGAKAVTFGLLYGSSVNGIAFTLHKSVEEAQEIIDTYFDKFPRVKTFIADCHAMAKDNGFVYTPFGQRKQEFGATDCFMGSTAYNGSLRNAQNVMIQSPASTLGLIVFSELNERVKALGGRAVCTVYDSIELEIPIDRLAEAVEIGFLTMDDWPVERFDWLDFAIGADCEIGWNWGDIVKVKRGATQESLMNMLRELDENRYEEAWEDLQNAA